MPSVHVHYSAGSAPMFRRMVDGVPWTFDGFRFDEDISSDDGWLVLCEPLSQEFSTKIPVSRRAICMNEPSPLNQLSEDYMNQFGVLISPYSIRGFRGHWIQTHTGLPWFFGATMGKSLLPTMTQSELLQMTPGPKSNTVSVVVSNKVFHKGHRTRLRLLEQLQERLGERLKLYGRGIREIDDKAEAILPSALHLALENTIEPSYWTEKLSDALIGFALPVYGGCPDLDRWIPEQAFLRIDPEDVDGTCNTIVRALDENLHQQRLPAILEARQKILTSESAYHVIARSLAQFPSDEPALNRARILRTPGRGGFWSRLKREARRAFFKLAFRTRLTKQ